MIPFLPWEPFTLDGSFSGCEEAGFMLKNDRYYEPVCKLAYKALLAYD